jgi:hypothetical protein
LATTANVKRPGDLAVPGRLRAWLRGRAANCAEALRDDYAGTILTTSKFLKSPEQRTNSGRYPGPSPIPVRATSGRKAASQL